MDIQYAKKLLTILADGIHPITGEVLPPEDSCNHPQVIRALHAVLSEKSDQEKQNALEKKLPENAGKPWTQEDDALLNEMFEKGCSSKEMRQFFKRTSGSIAARLVKLGKIKDRFQL